MPAVHAIQLNRMCADEHSNDGSSPRSSASSFGDDQSLPDQEDEQQLAQTRSTSQCWGGKAEQAKTNMKQGSNFWSMVRGAAKSKIASMARRPSMLGDSVMNRTSVVPIGEATEPGGGRRHSASAVPQKVNRRPGFGGGMEDDSTDKEFNTYRDQVMAAPALSYGLNQIVSTLQSDVASQVKKGLYGFQDMIVKEAWKTMEGSLKEMRKVVATEKMRADGTLKRCREMETGFIKETTLLRDKIRKVASGIQSDDLVVSLWEPLRHLDPETRALVEACAQERLKDVIAGSDYGKMIEQRQAKESQELVNKLEEAERRHAEDRARLERMLEDAESSVDRFSAEAARAKDLSAQLDKMFARMELAEEDVAQTRAEVGEEKRSHKETRSALRHAEAALGQIQAEKDWAALTSAMQIPIVEIPPDSSSDLADGGDALSPPTKDGLPTFALALMDLLKELDGHLSAEVIAQASMALRINGPSAALMLLKQRINANRSESLVLRERVASLTSVFTEVSSRLHPDAPGTADPVALLKVVREIVFGVEKESSKSIPELPAVLQTDLFGVEKESRKSIPELPAVLQAEFGRGNDAAVDPVDSAVHRVVSLDGVSSAAGVSITARAASATPTTPRVAAAPPCTRHIGRHRTTEPSKPDSKDAPADTGECYDHHAQSESEVGAEQNVKLQDSAGERFKPSGNLLSYKHIGGNRGAKQASQCSSLGLEVRTNLPAARAAPQAGPPARPTPLAIRRPNPERSEELLMPGGIGVGNGLRGPASTSLAAATPAALALPSASRRATQQTSRQASAQPRSATVPLNLGPQWEQRPVTAAAASPVPCALPVGPAPPIAPAASPDPSSPCRAAARPKPRQATVTMQPRSATVPTNLVPKRELL